MNYIILQRQEHAVGSAPFNTSLLAVNGRAVTVCYICFNLRLNYNHLIVILCFLKSIGVSEKEYLNKYKNGMEYISEKALLSKKNNGLQNQIFQG